MDLIVLPPAILMRRGVFRKSGICLKLLPWICYLISILLVALAFMFLIYEHRFHDGESVGQLGSAVLAFPVPVLLGIAVLIGYCNRVQGRSRQKVSRSQFVTEFESPDQDTDQREVTDPPIESFNV
ncbi:MAG: hypothetical protein AAF456_19085 [Planctomycetota bacterium]